MPVEEGAERGCREHTADPLLHLLRAGLGEPGLCLFIKRAKALGQLSRQNLAQCCGYTSRLASSFAPSLATNLAPQLNLIHQIHDLPFRLGYSYLFTDQPGIFPTGR